MALTCIDDGLVRQLEQQSRLRVHVVRLFAVHAEELSIKEAQVLDLARSGGQSVEALRPSAFVGGDHVHVLVQVRLQLVDVVRLGEAAGDARDDDLLVHLPLHVLVLSAAGAGRRGRRCVAVAVWCHCCAVVRSVWSCLEEMCQICVQ